MPPGPGTTDATTSSTSTTSTSTTGELSTGSGSGTASTSGVTLLDVGNDGDAGSLYPEGCKGKIDHIMVIKGDPWWGVPGCTSQCPALAPGCDGYPCDLVDIVTACDETWGAGAVFNAGNDPSQEPCAIVNGRRYLTPDQPDLPETFACIAKVGTDGGDLLGEALVHALSPGLNVPGGCNEGFLRDDALLVVTLATDRVGTGRDRRQERRREVRGDVRYRRPPLTARPARARAAPSARDRRVRPRHRPRCSPPARAAPA